MSSSNASISTQKFCINVNLLESTCKNHTDKPRDKRFIIVNLFSATVIIIIIISLFRVGLIGSFKLINANL